MPRSIRDMLYLNSAYLIPISIIFNIFVSAKENWTYKTIKNAQRQYSTLGNMCTPNWSTCLNYLYTYRLYLTNAQLFLYNINLLCLELTVRSGASGSVVGWGTMLQAGRSRVRVPMRWIFFNWSNPSSRTMARRSTQPLTEMSTRNLHAW
jgi:hypothetical protein